MYKAITGLTTKMGMRLVLVFLLFVSTGLHAETLMRLEAITSRYSTLKAFLQDPAAVTEYRDALKLYMGEDKSFDAVYDEFIRQIKEVQEKVTGFGAQAWAVNLDWQKQGFTISGEHAGSGLEIKREALFSEIEKLKAETKLTATSLIEGTAKTADLIAELKSTYGLLTEAEMGKFSRGQHAAYRKRLLGDEENGVPKISDHPAAKALAAYAVHELLEKDERFSDAFYSQDADITVRTLKKLDRLPELHEAIGDLGVDIPKSILSYLKFTSPASEKIVSEYESGIASMKAFRHIADAKIDLALLTRMQQLQAEGIEAHQIPERLNDVEREKLRDWQVKTQAVRGKKRALADSYNLKNPFFSYQFHEDSARGTLRLKSETPTELHLVASPRPFHAFFAGRKTKECVGGRDCENLAPKRWARAALKGTVNFFTEIGNQKMEGMVALTPLIREVDGKTITYDVLDLMSHALKGDVIVRDEAGRQIKYSMFDEFVDRYRVAAGSAGLIISNGNNVSQNVQGGEVVNYSAAYLENQEVGKPDDFSPLDPMAKEIVRLFPNIYMNYGRGGMVYDGMRGDGTKVVRLVPSRERRKWTKEELEDDLIEALLTKKQISDKDILWKRA